MPVLRSRPRLASAIILAAASATIAGALGSQHIGGLVPCKLCLLQRQPYYLGIPIAAAILLVPVRDTYLRIGLWLLALVFLVSAGLGAYHAGVEWGWFLGPSDCGGGTGPASTDVGDLLQQLSRIKVVSCTEAAWRFAGLSLAGWNALISAALGGIAAWGALSPGNPVPYGSSSVSQ